MVAISYFLVFNLLSLSLVLSLPIGDFETEKDANSIQPDIDLEVVGENGESVDNGDKKTDEEFPSPPTDGSNPGVVEEIPTEESMGTPSVGDNALPKEVAPSKPIEAEKQHQQQSDPVQHQQQSDPVQKPAATPAEETQKPELHKQLTPPHQEPKPQKESSGEDKTKKDSKSTSTAAETVHHQQQNNGPTNPLAGWPFLYYPPYSASLPFLPLISTNFLYPYGSQTNTERFRCTSDGLYYRDLISFYSCTNGQPAVQYCAPGTMNPPLSAITSAQKAATGVQVTQLKEENFCSSNIFNQSYMVAPPTVRKE